MNNCRRRVRSSGLARVNRVDGRLQAALEARLRGIVELVRVATMNVNGIRAAASKGALEYLASRDLDLICLQEVRAQPEQLPDTPAGFEGYWDLGDRAGYSGVGILSRVAPLEVAAGLGVPAFDAEGRVLRLRFPALDVVSVYVPSGTTGEERQDFKMAFLASLEEFVRDLLASGRPLLLLGDLNIAHQEIDLARPQANRRTSGFLPQERAWLTELLELGLHDVVRERAGPESVVYSWWTYRAGARQKNVGWRLDYQLATPELAGRARTLEVPREPVLSDHAPVIVAYDVELMEPAR